MAETLKGLMERVTYHNPENGFAVLKVKVRGRQDRWQFISKAK
jgi:exodeoxyribonuclease V alpha subunit